MVTFGYTVKVEQTVTKLSEQYKKYTMKTKHKSKQLTAHPLIPALTSPYPEHSCNASAASAALLF